MRFGRNRPLGHGPRLKLSNYLPRMPVAPPQSVDYSTPAAPALANIFGNDQLGDCVVAAGYHIAAVATGGAGNLYTASLADIVADYGKIGGYIPGQPDTDQGCDPTVAQNYWMATGFRNGTRLTGALAVDPSNRIEIQVAMYLFENLFLGFECPDAWVNPFPSGTGFLWDAAGAPNPNNGHQVMGCGYGAEGVTIDTWAMLGTLSYDAIALYCSGANGGDVSTFLTPDVINKAIGKAPNGLDWATLIDDYDAIGGHVAPVVVPPSPSPGPVPTSTILTLAQAQAALAQGWPQ